MGLRHAASNVRLMQAYGADRATKIWSLVEIRLSKSQPLPPVAADIEMIYRDTEAHTTIRLNGTRHGCRGKSR